MEQLQVESQDCRGIEVESPRNGLVYTYRANKDGVMEVPASAARAIRAQVGGAVRTARKTFSCGVSFDKDGNIIRE